MSFDGGGLAETSIGEDIRFEDREGEGVREPLRAIVGKVARSPCGGDVCASVDRMLAIPSSRISLRCRNCVIVDSIDAIREA